MHTCTGEKVLLLSVQLLNQAICFLVEGYSGVVEPSECIHISDKAKAIAKVIYYFFTCLITSGFTLRW